MKQDFYLPDIGEGIVECELVEWLVSEGDKVAEDQAICDVMTDKALVQIPAVHGGTITRLYVAKGEMARVHAPLFEMEVAGTNDGKAASQASPPAPGQTAESAAPGPESEAGRALRPGPVQKVSYPTSGRRARRAVPCGRARSRVSPTPPGRGRGPRPTPR
ncbi:biotin/lipoyl-containing protein, partial [Zobellella denitrificans]|uniref:biotin/lipoyl-containing protein n=1 Tax=Zobellella denitrificans TaxID=347534 RepID=UPI0026E3A310